MKLRMKIRQTGAVTPAGGRKALNVEHRTSNECILSILKKILRSLRLVGVLTPAPRRAIPSFEIRYSLFDILRFAV